jgi:hypothetical protein
MKNIANQATILTEMKPIPLASHDTRRVLAPVLEHGQGFIQLLIHFLAGDNPGNSTHKRYLDQ